jgi:hypothetical protein
MGDKWPCCKYLRPKEKAHLAAPQPPFLGLLELIASGAAKPEILGAYPHLTAEDIEAAMLYASRVLKNESLFEVEIPR